MLHGLTAPLAAAPSTPTKRPIAVDLFAGVGGMSLGLERAGFDVLVAAELDPIHALTHLFNLPQTGLLYGDLSSGSVKEIASQIRSLLKRQVDLQDAHGEPEIDALVGGPPCQGFSVGGMRNASDARNDLLMRFVDLVVELRPRTFCLENVGGLLESRFTPLRREVFKKLDAAGYAVGGLDVVEDAAEFGVPQSRRRVLAMGSLDGDAPHLRNPSEARVTVAEALAGLPDITQYRRLLRSDEVELNYRDLQALTNADSDFARRMVGVSVDVSDRSYPRILRPELLTNSLRTVHNVTSRRRFARTEPGTAEPVSRLFRLHPDRVARTLRAGTGSDRGSHTSPRPIHPDYARAITVREAARLHGYPDWFRFNATNWHGHRQVGNSVPPPLSTAVGHALLAALGLTQGPRPTQLLPFSDSSWLRMSPASAHRALGSLPGCKSLDQHPMS